jgi:hypothetical protein
MVGHGPVRRLMIVNFDITATCITGCFVVG